MQEASSPAQMQLQGSGPRHSMSCASLRLMVRKGDGPECGIQAHSQLLGRGAADGMAAVGGRQRLLTIRARKLNALHGSSVLLHTGDQLAMQDAMQCMCVTLRQQMLLLNVQSRALGQCTTWQRWLPARTVCSFGGLLVQSCICMVATGARGGG
jgi:hypothetical protein